MNPFRGKKSDSQQSSFPLPTQFASHPTTVLPEIPQASDFRTSLILKDLSKRFSVLRLQTGEPVTVRDLRHKFAEQRRRGARNQITETEEAMLLETLGRMRSKTTSGKPQDTVNESVEHPPDRSTSTVNSTFHASPTSSPSAKATKRYSNNLFGSGRLRDYTYFKNAGSNLGRASSARASSMTPTETSISIQEISSLHDSLQPLTSETSSMKSGSDSKFTNPYILVAATDEPLAETSPAIDSSVLRRASNAFADAIKELEEETEDEVVLPRLARPSLDSGPRQPESVAELARSSQSSLHSPTAVETGTAISSDKQVITHNDPRASPVHSRTLPGYIPGMPRPMTPRDLDMDEQRSHSTTPRAMSPLPMDVASTVASRHLSSVSASLVSVSPQPSSPPLTTTAFRPSTPSRSTPLFLQRSPSGRRTPDNGSTTTDVAEFDHPLNASIISCRRTASPSTASMPNNPPAMSSHPTTPSNIVWKPNGHERNGSWLGDSGMSDSQSLNLQSSISRQISPLPDSTVVDQVSGGDSSSNISGSARVARSPTPSHNSPRSLAFPNIDISPRNGSKRSSRQNTASPFLFGQYTPLVLLPAVSSSRSSLESIGSSYHSWEGEKDRYLSVFSDPDTQQAAWHDIRVERANSAIFGEFADDDEWDPEEIIGRYTALKTSDFKAIQEKLVSLSMARDDARERVPSIRRRRPSTSQSNYSVNGRDRIASPPPASPIAMSSEQISAVLGAAADNVLSRPPDAIDTSIQRVPSEPSPNTRRNRDLAQALFGDDLEKERESTPKPSFLHITKEPRSEIAKAFRGADIENTSSMEKFTSSSSLSPNVSKFSDSIQKTDLVREVQEKAEAATSALRKNPPNNEPRVQRSILGSISRRRINPNQISEPRLVSASISVDAVPIRPIPANNSGTSKIGSRFRKLRGSLRSKNPVANRDATQMQNEASQSYSLSKPKPSVGVANVIENGRSKVAVASESTPTTPRLKGFIARFRGKKSTENVTLDRRGAPQVSSSVISLANSQADRTTLPSSVANDHVVPFSDSLLQHVSEQINPSQGMPPVGLDSNTVALRQLFDAASNLGLDQDALNALIASSSSLSRPATGKSGLPAVAGSTEGSKRNQPMIILASENGWTWPQPSSDEEVDPKHDPSNRSEAVDWLPSETQKSEDGMPESVPNNVVRRTIIYPSDSQRFSIPSDPNLLAKKGSHRRRASMTSTSSRSIQDRVPTPPPPRSPTSKSFTNGPSPPVPQIPHSLLSNAELHKTSAYVPRQSFEKPTSAYDSLYEMYGEEAGKEFLTSHSNSVPNSNPDAPALELIELENGETIWSIVNGLRDEDDESTHGGRTSFTSEFSTREANSDGLQIYVKEHRKTGSKGSNLSVGSRGRILKNRPETKVYYSTSTQIGRLIESLSHGMGSGSFKISSNPLQPGHSASSSLSLQPSINDVHWTVEEHLEHMLESIAKG